MFMGVVLHNFRHFCLLRRKIWIMNQEYHPLHFRPPPANQILTASVQGLHSEVISNLFA